MSNWKKFPRVIFLLILLVGLLAGFSAPALGGKSVSAAPMRASLRDVIISEVAWGGTAAAYTTDEWIELYNPTGSAINLSGWTLVSNDTLTPTPNISLTGSIPAYGYYLLESGDDFTVSDILADQIYSGTLNNTGETLTLTDNLLNVIDTANISGGGWDAGHTVSGPAYSSMERIGVAPDSATAWVANDGLTRNGLAADGTTLVLGTPHTSKVDLSLTMTVNDLAPNVGDTVIFTITVSNINSVGYGTATNVQVRDLLPSGLTHLSNTPSVGLYDFTSGIWTVGTLSAGSSATLTIDANVEPSGLWTNTAEVWFSDQLDADSTPGNASTIIEDDNQSTPVVPQISADLSLALYVNDVTPSIGDTILLTITVSNLGPDSATGVVIKDLLPAGLTYVAHTVGETYDKDTGLWLAGTVPVGAGNARILNITARVDTKGAKINLAEVLSADQPDPNSMNNAASVTVTPSVTSLTISNVVNTQNPIVGSNVVFTIKVTNPSATLNATGVSVSAPLLSGLQYVSYSSTSGTYTAGVWSIGGLNAGANATLTVTARVISKNPLPYSATVSSNEFADSTATAPILNPLVGESNLRLEPDSLPFTVSTSIPRRGNLNLHLYNDGPDKATNIQVRDLLPSGLDYVTYSSSLGSYESGSGLWSISELLPGANATLSITVDVAASGTSTRNFAEVWQSDQYDPDSTPGNGEQATPEDDETFWEVPIADLSLSETVNAAGGNAVFTITVRNSGPDTADGKVKTALAGYTHVSDDGGGNFTQDVANNVWIWDVGSLAKNSSATLTITTTYSGSPLVNWAEVSAANQVDPDSVPNNNSHAEDDDAGAPSADLSITKSVNNINPDVGTHIIFTIVVHNSGPLGTNNVKVKDFLPFGLTYVSDTGGGAYSGSNGIWAVGFLANGAYKTLQITARVAASGVKTNWAEVWASDESDPDSTPGNNSQIEDDDASVVITPSSNPTPTPTRTVTRTPSRTPTRTLTRTPTQTRTPTVTGTPPTRTPTRTRTPTPAPYKPVGRPVINEFLPRPGYDWNQDGKVDVYDEFIEIKNIGITDVNLRGWQLDDEENSGSSPFELPTLVLKPGQHAVFYALQTNILLSDGGDTVRLLNPDRKIYDAYTYPIARAEDQSVCRLPDGNGSWYEDCIPTPNLINSREGEVPSMPGGAFESPICQLPDTLPADFLFAECRGYGADIWRSYYWDQFGWQGDQYVPENMSKWESFVE